MWGLNDILTHSLAYGMGEEEEKAKAEREKKASNNWHTGKPTEEGWYLIKYKWDGEIRYIATDTLVKTFVEDSRTIGWQKIEENEDGQI